MMSSQAETIPVRATELLVDTLNQVVDLSGDSAEKIRLVLGRLQQLLARETRCVIWLMDQLSRQPAPRIYVRIVARGPHDDPNDVGIAGAQQAMDDATPMTRVLVSRMLNDIRTPTTLIASQADDEWFKNILLSKYLVPMGYADCIASMWASSADRAICLLCHRRESEPAFAENDSTMMSLMLRASAPIIDREMFRCECAEQIKDLSAREREILLLLLSGDSEKEIARSIHRSAHTVHTFIQKLYRIFQVSSRGELMAQFIDKAVLDCIRKVRSA
jgi:DNA-binding NarL/FixJ family response regulator